MSDLCAEPMSPVRRTFCLLTLFDLGLSFLLWILYTQITGMSPMEAFTHEVVQYNIHLSLFDLVMLAAGRFVCLILAYGLCRLHNPWVVAVTTAGSSAFLIAKVFLYTFAQGGNKDSPILDYILLVSSFILSWTETWFLDFKVLPRETKERLEQLKRAASESTPLLYGGALRYDQFSDTGGSNSAYYSPVQGGSPETRSLAGEDVGTRKRTEPPHEVSPLTAAQDRCMIIGRNDECLFDGYSGTSDGLCSLSFPHYSNDYIIQVQQDTLRSDVDILLRNSLPQQRSSCFRAISFPKFFSQHLVQRIALIERAKMNLAVVKEFQNRSGWKLEKQGKCGSSVYSLDDKKYGKIFRVEGLVRAASDDVFSDIYQKVNEAVNWNHTIAFSERVDLLDDHCDVTYVCVKDQAGGMVSSRDFVDVRCFEMHPSELGNRYVIAGIGCEHPRKPVTKEFVRGVNGPNAWINEPVAPSANGAVYSKFICFSNTNLKGWIPQKVVDQAMASVLLELIRSLQKKYEPNIPDCSP
ncbi:stAR-related lipid transfer protein 3-like isoform X2 [Paramacrobiotus metropolitanus]|uniref:stAR-related lipid transfer protein 3-like isoform X2 n=1 Tax=Paramacrobiotus metropolitanus TaxID=2943436 RepID=UPI00244587A6|nr:stAR-related lipid transfer protein 3-like isoform X2 [Paramacrobiotus metropolitanus]